MSNWAVGIDIGGTFTDVVALAYGQGASHSLKVLTTHDNPAEGVAQGVTQLMQICGILPAQVSRIVHATTLFTNALIERRGARTGLIVTRGFKDVLEIGHERKYDLYDLNIEAAPPLVERALRGEISGRLSADGEEVEPLDAEEIVRVVRSLVDQGVQSIAVCLLHAYAGDKHERTVADLIHQHFPGLALTLSSEVAPVVREFERLSTTCANAYIKPLANHYLSALQNRLSDIGLNCGVLMMLSNGGLTHIDEARRVPIELLESGPAAGAISAAHYSLRDEHENLLAFDMGGTTAKLCLVEKGRPAIAFGFEAARQKRFAEGSGLPIRIATVDLIEIGAGGGSVAHRDPLGLLKVGPQSSGSEPGPACYGRGGQAPTVTDANLLLGYLNPAFFAGGTLDISPELACAALTRVSAELSREVIDVAWGIHDIVAENMAGAARVHVAERGRDPRDFILLCTGGGGPLHAYYVARKIGVRTIMCPPSAGVASAYGLLVAPARADRSRTLQVRPAADGLQAVEAAFVEIETQARASLTTLDKEFGPIRITRHADGRFVGQGFTLTVALPDGPYIGAEIVQDDIRKSLIHAFETAYREKFGRTPPDVDIELVNLRVSGEAPAREALTQHVSSSALPTDPKEIRPVYFVEAGGMVQTPVFDRNSIRAGFDREGPMLIEDAGSTLVVGPLGRVQQLESGNLIIRIQE